MSIIDCHENMIFFLSDDWFGEYLEENTALQFETYAHGQMLKIK